MVHLKLALLAAFGGAIGSSARYLTQTAARYLFGPQFPWGTLFVNIVGSLLMGLVAGFAIHRSMLSPELRLFLATGVLGGFTTFSAFALDAAFLAEKSVLASTAYVTASVVLSIAALYFGLALAKLGA